MFFEPLVLRFRLSLHMTTVFDQSTCLYLGVMVVHHLISCRVRLWCWTNHGTVLPRFEPRQNPIHCVPPTHGSQQTWRVRLSV